MRIFRQTVVLLRQQIEADQKKENRHEMTMDTGEYANIILGRKTFLITKDIGFVQGDSVVIREIWWLRY